MATHLDDRTEHHSPTPAGSCAPGLSVTITRELTSGLPFARCVTTASTL